MTPASSLLRRRAALALLALMLCPAPAAAQAALELPGGERIEYRHVEAGADSAREVAFRMLEHLAEGEIEDAAMLSTAPRRRFEVLQAYRRSVGNEEFRRVFRQYLTAPNRLAGELAVGPRRLVLWELAEAEGRIAGQTYVQIEGRFLLDEVPGPERARLRLLLEAARRGEISLSARTD